MCDERLLTDKEIMNTCGMLSINYRKTAKAQLAKDVEWEAIKDAEWLAKIEEIVDGELSIQKDADQFLLNKMKAECRQKIEEIDKHLWDLVNCDLEIASSEDIVGIVSSFLLWWRTFKQEGIDGN